jgi:hypothetical protein
MRRLLLLSVLLLLPAAVQAQTHYCDTTPPTSGTGTVGVALTIQACASPNDTNGNPVTVTGWTLYDNAVGTAVTMTKGTTSPVSGKTVYAGSYTPPTAGSHSLQTTATGNAKESAKSTPFLLAVSLPPAAPVAPTNLTAQ